MDSDTFVTTGYVTRQRGGLLSITVLACLVSAWRRVHPRPAEHHCIV